MNLTPLSQRDVRWKDIPLGTSVFTTIGTHGCTITALAIRFGLTPDYINQELNRVDGFAPSNPTTPQQLEKNLVIWKKLEEALPGITFEFRHYVYNNELVKQNLPCLVEVDGRPIGGFRHWVVYIGDQKLIDPWDGTVKDRSSYVPISFVVLKGEHTREKPHVLNTYGLDIQNKESMQVVFDTWRDVSQNNYIKRDEHTLVVKTLQDEIEKLKREGGTLNGDAKYYTEMKALGYNTIDDIRKVIEKKENDNLKLQKENAQLLHSNATLAGIVKDIQEEDSQTAQMGLSLVDENAELKRALSNVAHVVGAEKIEEKSVMKSVINVKGLADNFLNMVKREEEKKEVVSPSPVVKEKKVYNANWFLNIFNLGVREVK